jgi:hypothetical protein
LVLGRLPLPNQAIELETLPLEIVDRAFRLVGLLSVAAVASA